MNITVRILAIFSLLFVFNQQVSARGGQQGYQEKYHIGVMTGNIDGGAEYGDVSANGFVIAARNSKASLEYFNMGSDQGNDLSNNQWEASLSGFYLSLIGQGQPYMKFKVGKIKHEMITTVASVRSSETNSVTSYGLGFGYKLGDTAMIEFDVTTLDKDMTLFSLAILF